jgi:hypothetical protein
VQQYQKLKKTKTKTQCLFGGAIVASSAQNLLCLCSFSVAVWATVMILFLALQNTTNPCFFSQFSHLHQKWRSATKGFSQIWLQEK